jgi:hypothetical protein
LEFAVILSTRMSVRIADFYFDEPAPAGLKADIIRYNQSPVPTPGSDCTPCSTIVVDLSLPQDELFCNLKSHTRQKIRRTQRDELTYEFSNDGDQDTLVRFADHLNRCRDLKLLPRVGRKRLFILARQKALDLSWVRDQSGEMLCASSYVITPFRVRGLLAGASYRNTTDPTRRTMIGRANRLLYWRDIVRFKEAGFRFFDFGGYYMGSEDQEKLRINGFKEEFGGEVLHEFNCQKGMTVKGNFMLWAIRRRSEWMMRKRSRALQSTVEENESSIPASI